MFKKKWILPCCILLFLLLLSLVWAIFFPFFYCGSFLVEDYQAQISSYAGSYEEYPNTRRYLLPPGETIADSYQAFRLAKTTGKVEPWSCYFVTHDDAAKIWKIEIRCLIPFHMFFSGIINNLADRTVIISDSGELLGNTQVSVPVSGNT